MLVTDFLALCEMLELCNFLFLWFSFFYLFLCFGFSSSWSSASIEYVAEVVAAVGSVLLQL